MSYASCRCHSEKACSHKPPEAAAAKQTVPVYAMSAGAATGTVIR